MMITTIGTGVTQESINTVVTILTHNVASGITMLETSDVNVDFAGLAR
jgi:hypothetical protein